MPRIKHYVHKYVSKAEDDKIIQEQCLKFSDITLSQLRCNKINRLVKISSILL